MSGLVTLHGLPHETDTPAEGAALYASLGWQVFPCKGKQPITSDGFKGASADPAKVATWWQANPTANVGWALPAGWFALDVDPRHGGDASLLALQREHEPLPWTLRAHTGGGGEHWIYRVPAGVEIRQMAGFRPGLDTRLGGRGYLLVCPSVHPETGKPYRWYATVEPTEPPAWLDRDHPDVRVVRSSEFFEATEKLPTYNSHAIEAQPKRRDPSPSSLGQASDGFDADAMVGLLSEARQYLFKGWRWGFLGA